jgi:hypothetical protein
MLYMDRKILISKALEAMTQFEECIGPLAFVGCPYIVYAGIKPYIRPEVGVEAYPYLPNDCIWMADSEGLKSLREGINMVWN